MAWPDGRKYEGEYWQDHKHGEGTFIWPDGSFFCGQWVDGKKQGDGSYTNSEGLARQGRWVQDQQTHRDDVLINEKAREDTRKMQEPGESVPAGGREH